MYDTYLRSIIAAQLTQAVISSLPRGIFGDKVQDAMVGTVWIHNIFVETLSRHISGEKISLEEILEEYSKE